MREVLVLEAGDLYFEDIWIGEIRKELHDVATFKYVMALNEAVILSLVRTQPTIHLATFIPGLDMEQDGFYREFDELPFLVAMRVPDQRRGDVAEGKFSQVSNFYDPFTYYLDSGGRSLDGFWVQRK